MAKVIPFNTWKETEQNRLHINTDSKGNFARATGAIPAGQDAALRVAAFDYDTDGDQDLFIGGRVTPGKWPLTPRSIVLRNDRNRCDAGTGALLLGGKKGQFIWRNNLNNGFWARGEVRDLAALRGTGGKMQIIVANNNAQAQVYLMKQAVQVQ